MNGGKKSVRTWSPGIYRSSRKKESKHLKNRKKENKKKGSGKNVGLGINLFGKQIR